MTPSTQKTLPSDIVLLKGWHRERDQGVCAMEAVAWLAGETHGESPVCACPTYSGFLRRLNDAEWPSDADRTEALLPILPLMLGTGVIGPRTSEEVRRASDPGNAEEVRRSRELMALGHVFCMRAIFLVICALENAGHSAKALRAAALAYCESPNDMTSNDVRTVIKRDCRTIYRIANVGYALSAYVENSLWEMTIGEKFTYPARDGARAASAADAAHVGIISDETRLFLLRLAAEDSSNLLRSNAAKASNP